LYAGTAFTYELFVAGSSAKVNKGTGLLDGAVSIGPLTIADSAKNASGKFDPTTLTSVVTFKSLIEAGITIDGASGIQFQLRVTYTSSAYTESGSNGIYGTSVSKALKLALPKWFT
jgi:hypothetical protein